jgi:folate-binding protein YgfZ
MLEMNDSNSDLISFFTGFEANIEEVNGSTKIKNFVSVEDEIYSLYNGVGLRYLNSCSIIELKGKDTLEFLHRISTNSLKELQKEEVKKTVFTTDKGKIIGLATILNFDSYLLLVTGKYSKLKIISWIRKYIVLDDVLVSDADHRFKLLELTGPQTTSFLSLFIGNTISEIPDNSFKVVSAENILFFLAKIKDQKGNDKFLILSEQENAKKLITNMVENKGPFDFNLIGDDAYNVYRIENGIPVDPNELNDNFNPLEANIKNLVDNSKGCYIGQEVISKVSNKGAVKNKLVGLTFSETVDGVEQFNLIDDKKEVVGQITSIAYSPRNNKNVGLGYIRQSFAEPGTKVVAKNGNKSVEVLIHELPFNK